MNNPYKQLLQCNLFDGFTLEEIEGVMKGIKYHSKSYKKGEIIALEGEEAKEVGLVVAGELTINKLYEDGKQMHVKQMLTGNLIGFAFVFSDSSCYSSTLIAATNAVIIHISHEHIINLCFTNKKFLNNFLKLVSNQLVYISDKLKFVNYSTIRKKVANYILQEYKKQKNLTITLSVSRKIMADSLGVTRPALSNEMINMKKDGLIRYENNVIDIIDLNKLTQEL